MHVVVLFFLSLRLQYNSTFFLHKANDFFQFHFNNFHPPNNFFSLAPNLIHFYSIMLSARRKKSTTQNLRLLYNCDRPAGWY